MIGTLGRKNILEYIRKNKKLEKNDVMKDVENKGQNNLSGDWGPRSNDL